MVDDGRTGGPGAEAAADPGSRETGRRLFGIPEEGPPSHEEFLIKIILADLITPRWRERPLDPVFKRRERRG